MQLDIGKVVKEGFEKELQECELTIGMTLKEAVEKQIPKKTKVVRSNFVNLDRFCCPSCGKGLIEKLDSEWVAGRLNNYCADCGQKIDWSDET